MRQPILCKKYILVGSYKNAIDDLARVNDILRQCDFLISPRKVINIDIEPATDILGVIIVNKHKTKYIRFSRTKDTEWKQKLQAFLNESSITYQNLHSLLGSIPKYSVVYSPWLKSLCYKFQSIASRERNQNGDEWYDNLKEGLHEIAKEWIRASITFEPLMVSVYIKPQEKFTIYVNSSKNAIGYMIYQNDNLIHQDNEILPFDRASLNITYKELVALRSPVSYISRLQTLTKKNIGPIQFYTDSKVLYNVIKNERVKSIPAASRNHVELIHREYVIIRELLTAIGCKWQVKHIDGKENPSDQLTRHPPLDMMVTYEKTSPITRRRMMWSIVYQAHIEFNSKKISTNQDI